MTPIGYAIFLTRANPQLLIIPLLQVIHERLQDRPAKLGVLDDKEIERTGVKVGKFGIVGTIIETDPVTLVAHLARTARRKHGSGGLLAVFPCI
jgi:hypothetical protein